VLTRVLHLAFLLFKFLAERSPTAADIGCFALHSSVDTGRMSLAVFRVNSSFAELRFPTRRAQGFDGVDKFDQSCKIPFHCAREAPLSLSQKPVEWGGGGGVG
jgi:hypothetical protein